MNHHCEERFTVERWLKSKMPLLDEDGIKSILVEFGIEPDLEPSMLTAREKDLMLAQGYFDMVMAVSTSAEVKDSDGNWSHSEGARTISDKDKQMWKNMYIRLRKKWGEEVMFPPSIKMDARGFSTWRKV